MTVQGHNFSRALVIACTMAALAGIAPAGAAAAASTPTTTTAPATTTPAPATTTQAPASTTPASGAQPGTVAPGATPTTITPTTSVPATTTPPAATTPTATTPATTTPATTTPSGATSPGSPTTTVIGASRNTPQSTRLSAGTLALAILGALLALGCLVWVVGRWLALEPRWSVSMMHSLREAGYHASATWAEFSDWARIGR